MQQLKDNIFSSSLKPIKQAYQQDKEAFQKLLNTCDEEGKYPLYHACEIGDISIIKLLLSIENNPTIINSCNTKNHWTCLIVTLYSQEDGNPDIISLLLEESADINIKDKDGNTALHHASIQGQTNVIEMLMKNKKCNKNPRNNIGETPLHLAIKHSEMWAFQELLKSGADVEVYNENGEGLYHYAVATIGNSIQFLRLLHQHGLKTINKEDNTGRTPLMLAQIGKKNDERLIQTLKELGAIDIKQTKKAENQAVKKLINEQVVQKNEGTPKIIIFTMLCVAAVIFWHLNYAPNHNDYRSSL